MILNSLVAYNKYIIIGFYLLFAIVLVVRTLWGLKAGLLKALIRAIGTALAVAATFATFSLVFKALQPTLSSMLEQYLNSQEGMAVLNDLDASKESVIATVEGLCGPLVFTVLFIMWNVLFAIVSLIIRCVLKLIPLKSKLASKLGGAGVSLVTGLVVLMLIIMPIAGYRVEAVEIYKELDSSGAAEIDDETAQYFATLSENETVFDKFVATLTRPAFKFSSTIKTSDGTEIDSFKEIKFVIKLAPKLKALENMDFSDMSNVDFTAINAILDEVDDSDLISTIISEVLSKAGTEWKAGNEYLGINLKQQIATNAPGYENALDGVLDKLSTCNRANCSEVMREFTKALQSISSMVTYLNNLSNSSTETGSTPTAQELADLLKGLDQSTVDMILPAVSEEVLTNSGLDENQAKLASKVLQNTLTEVATMSDEEIDNEAEAIDTLLNYATNENANPDANEVIDALMQSKVVLTSAKTVVEEMPDESSAILGNVSEEQKTSISDALDNYQTEHPDADQENIDLIKSLFGIA